MSTSGVLQLGPHDLKAWPYYRWIAWKGPGKCEIVSCTAGDGIFWSYSMPGWRITLCEEHADDWKLDLNGGIPRRKGSEYDGPGECF
jgi:hypothetical protein